MALLFRNKLLGSCFIEIFNVGRDKENCLKCLENRNNKTDYAKLIRE
jgi:hypothetical protein